ncbi:MAG: helix-turn-helix domain-containing protein [Chitinivibrionales bacterium]|nr:helix-turn-helix domain-containing protein [Chitinivibrionales bacterium]
MGNESVNNHQATSGAYTVAELARRISAPEKSIRKWAAAGRVPGMLRLGRAIRFDKATIERRIAAGDLLLPSRN